MSSVGLIEVTQSQIVKNFGCLYINDYIDDLLVSLNALRLPYNGTCGLIIGDLNSIPQGNIKVLSYKEFINASIHWKSVSFVIFLRADRLYDFNDKATLRFIQSPIPTGCYRIFVYPNKKLWKYKDTEVYLPDKPENLVYTSKRLGVFGSDSTEDIYLKYFNGFKFPQSQYVRRGQFSKKRGFAYVMRVNEAMVLPLKIIGIENNTDLRPSSAGSGKFVNMEYNMAYNGQLFHDFAKFYLRNYARTKKKGGIPYIKDKENVLSLQNFCLYNYVEYCAKLIDCAKLHDIEEPIKSYRFAGLHGRPDFWSFSNDGVLEIVELKTGSYKNNTSRDNRQVEIYSFLVADKYLKDRSKIKQIKLTIFRLSGHKSRCYGPEKLTEYINWYKLKKESII